MQAVALCELCRKYLQNELLYSDLSTEQLLYLANWLTTGNHPELAKLLTESANKIIDDKMDNNRFFVLAESLKQFNSPKIAKYFTNYIVENQDIPFELQNAFSVSINNSPKRTEIAADIVTKFNQTMDTDTRNKLLAIAQPESLAQINLQALEQNNSELYNQTNELIKTNPSIYTLDVLLSMPQIKFVNTDEANGIMQMAYQLANSQFSGNRLDYIETKFAQGAYSAQDKYIVLDILSHSEDKVRSSEIIAKFSN